MYEDGHPPRRLSFCVSILRIFCPRCSLIDRIELHPRGDGKGVDAELHGDLAEILAFCDGSHGKFPKTGVSGSQLSRLDLQLRELLEAVVHS